jgi:hypothetical protein
MAEALNRAGFPETSFAVLAYGLSYDILNNRDIISQDEFDRLCEIKSYGFTLQDTKYTGDLLAQTTGSFVIWPSNVFATPDKNVASTSISSSGVIYVLVDGQSKQNMGIHSLGSGDTEYNKYYYLDDEETKAGLTAYPVSPDYADVPKLNSRSTAEDSLAYDSIVAYNDSLLAIYSAEVSKIDSINAKYLSSEPILAKRQAHVKKLILDEEALEGAFEGLRFYDLLRYQMQEGKVSGSSAVISLPDYIKESYGTMETDNMTGKPWYLTLPAR